MPVSSIGTAILTSQYLKKRINIFRTSKSNRNQMLFALGSVSTFISLIVFDASLLNHYLTGIRVIGTFHWSLEMYGPGSIFTCSCSKQSHQKPEGT